MVILNYENVHVDHTQEKNYWNPCRYSSNSIRKSQFFSFVELLLKATCQVFLVCAAVTHSIDK